MLRKNERNGETGMIAEELVILDPGSASWQVVRPLLTIVLALEQHEKYVWHGWNKASITSFLDRLPSPSTLIVGVWSTNADGQEQLQLGFVCEIDGGQVRTIRTFESLAGGDIPPVQELEPGAEHALAMMRYVRTHIAPVAWALFTDKETWDEWIDADEESDSTGIHGIDKGALLMAFAQQGRCVLMGSQAHQYGR